MMETCRECEGKLIEGENWSTSRAKKNDHACIPCEKARKHQYYQEHKEKYQAYARKRYYENRDERLVYARQYRKKHKKEQRAYFHQYRKENPDKVQECRQRRRASITNAAINDFIAADWQAVLIHYDNKCAYCGEAKMALELEHIIPISRGGNNTISNIVPACEACNDKKYVSTPAEAGMYLWKLPLTHKELADG